MRSTQENFFEEAEVHIELDKEDKWIILENRDAVDSTRFRIKIRYTQPTEARLGVLRWVEDPETGEFGQKWVGAGGTCQFDGVTN